MSECVCACDRQTDRDRDGHTDRGKKNKSETNNDRNCDRQVDRNRHHHTRTEEVREIPEETETGEETETEG